MFLPLGEAAAVVGSSDTWYSLLWDIVRQGCGIDAAALTSASWRFPGAAASPASLEEFQGAIDAASRLITQRVAFAFLPEAPPSDATVWDAAGITPGALSSLLFHCLAALKHRRGEVAASGAAALSRLFRVAPLPLPDGFEFDQPISHSPSEAEAHPDPSTPMAK